ncbi:MAG TPA: hypothetical protein ENI82_04515, partial [Bacteroidetes bacterium]|nr:hypothetical protein [Bacteroidota bacterium]
MTCRKVQVCYDCGHAQIVAEATNNDVLPIQESPDLTGVDKPLVFTSSSSDPIINDQFFFYKESILGRMKADNILEITGKYYKDEVNDSDFENLGLARAYEIRKLFLDKIPKNKIRLTGSLHQEKRDPEIGLFESADFFWV